MDEPTLVTTADGSHSLFLPSLNEHYHSRHGALQESLHVFIRHGLCHFPHLENRSLNIFEMGFGTGLNALLTLDQVIKNPGLAIRYTAIEAFPLSPEKAAFLNYPSQVNPMLGSAFREMHEKAEGEIVLHPGFTLNKLKCTLDNLEIRETFDLVYYDAFGPRVQPELWQKEALEKVTSRMNNNAAFVTYCAQGAFRRALRELGLDVESLPGPPFKREMTRAVIRK